MSTVCGLDRSAVAKLASLNAFLAIVMAEGHKIFISMMQMSTKQAELG
jgi:hypothetical protein